MPQLSWPRLAESLRGAPVIRKGSYDYFVHALSDGVLPLDADLLRGVAKEMHARMPAKVDRLLTAEAMGIPVAAALTLQSGVPFLVARKREYGLPGEVTVTYETGYSQGKLTVGSLQRGHRVVIVDDVVSRGGTLRALAEAVRQTGAILVKVIVAIHKETDLAALSQEIGAPIDTLVSIRVRNGAVEILD